MRVERFITERGEILARLGFVENGVPGTIVREVPDPLPPNWRAWAREKLLEHLASTNYALSNEVLFPDMSASEQAKDEFDNVPGWATWSADEAAQWIEDNVVDLGSAKTTLRAMARAIIYLRNIIIERE